MPRHYETMFFVNKEEKLAPGSLNMQPYTVVFRPIPEVTIFCSVPQFRELMEGYARQLMALEEKLPDLDFSEKQCIGISE